MAGLFSLDDLMKYLDTLTVDEFQQVMSMMEVKKLGLEKAKDNNLIVVNDKVLACPHCGSVAVKKHGTSEGKQRYRCKDCGKTFQATTETVFQHSKLNTQQWKELLRGMVNNLSLQKIADNIDVTAATVWYNRLKVLDAIAERFIQQDNFVDIAECDEFAVHLSFKGKRDAYFFVYILGRLPRHHRNREEKLEYLRENVSVK